MKTTTAKGDLVHVPSGVTLFTEDDDGSTRKIMKLSRPAKLLVTEINETTYPSICDAILTPTPGELTFPILKRNAGEGLVASETEVLQAMKLLYQHFKIVSEPGGAVAAAAAIFSKNKLKEKDIIAVSYTHLTLPTNREV